MTSRIGLMHVLGHQVPFSRASEAGSTAKVEKVSLLESVSFHVLNCAEVESSPAFLDECLVLSRHLNDLNPSTKRVLPFFSLSRL